MFYKDEYINNYLVGQEFNLHQYKNSKLVNVTADKSKCGHSENFKNCYSDSDSCFVCDCKELKEVLFGDN